MVFSNITTDQIKSLLLHRTMDTVLVHLNCHIYLVFVVVFTFVGGLEPGSDFACSFKACGYLLLAIIFYYCLSDNEQWPCTKVGEAGRLPLGRSTGRNRWLFQAWQVHILYILYLRCEDTICILHFFHGSTYISQPLLLAILYSMKCIAASGQMVINVDANSKCIYVRWH